MYAVKTEGTATTIKNLSIYAATTAAAHNGGLVVRMSGKAVTKELVAFFCGHNMKVRPTNAATTDEHAAVLAIA